MAQRPDGSETSEIVRLLAMNPSTTGALPGRQNEHKWQNVPWATLGQPVLPQLALRRTCDSVANGLAVIVATPVSSIEFRGAQFLEMRLRRLGQISFGPRPSAKMMQAAILCQDELQAVAQGIVSEQLLGRVIGNRNLDQDANELRHRRVVVGRSAKRRVDLRRASHEDQYGCSIKTDTEMRTQ
jgi:hypothetical protein